MMKDNVTEKTAAADQRQLPFFLKGKLLALHKALEGLYPVFCQLLHALVRVLSKKTANAAIYANTVCRKEGRLCVQHRNKEPLAGTSRAKFV